MTPEPMRSGALGLLTTHQAFRRLWAGQAASVLGDRVSGLAMPLAAVLVLRAGAPAMGVLTAAGLLPFLVLSIPVGAWVDRASHRRRLMLWADVARAVLTLTIPLAFVTHHLSLLLLGAVAALSPGSWSRRSARRWRWWPMRLRLPPRPSAWRGWASTSRRACFTRRGMLGGKWGGRQARASVSCGPRLVFVT